jgi:hypothetical protein
MQGDFGGGAGRQKKERFLSGQEHAIRRLEKVNLTESQRRDAINYHRGQAVEFHRRARGGFKSARGTDQHIG